MAKYILIHSIINSKAADDRFKGNLVYEEIKRLCQNNNDGVILDFKEIELVNTAFLNNAIGRLFNKAEFDISKNSVKVANMQKTMIDLLKESISIAKEKYS